MYGRDEIPGGTPGETNWKDKASLSTCHPELNDGTETGEEWCNRTVWSDYSLDCVRSLCGRSILPDSTFLCVGVWMGLYPESRWCPQERGQSLFRTSLARSVTTEVRSTYGKDPNIILQLYYLRFEVLRFTESHHWSLSCAR
jgi:hypothetical protein